MPEQNGPTLIAVYATAAAIYGGLIVANKAADKFASWNAKRKFDKEIGEWVRTSQDITNLPEVVE